MGSQQYRQFDFLSSTQFPIIVVNPQDYVDPGGSGNSSVEAFFWGWNKTIKGVILTPIVIFTILGNLLVLYAFLSRRRDLRSPTHFFIANLALADFLVGVLALPFLAVLEVTSRWYFGPVFCTAWVCIHFWLCSSSILSTCAICIERYIGVRYPLRYNEILTMQKLLGIIATVWIIAGLLSILPVTAWPETPSDNQYECKINQRPGHVIIATVGILYIPALIMVILYYKIYTIASRHLKLIRKKASVPTKGNAISTNSSNGDSSIVLSDVSKTFNLDDETSMSKTTGAVPSSLRKDVELDIGRGVGDGNGNAVKKWEKKNKKSVGNQDASSSSRTKQILLAKKLAFLVGFLLLSYLPFFTLFLIRSFNPASVPIRVFNAFGWLRYFNSCVNPVIYAWAVPAYRKAFKSIWRGVRTKNCCSNRIFSSAKI